MSSLIYFVLKVWLIIGIVAASQNNEKYKNAIIFPDQVNIGSPSRPTDETKQPKSIDFNGKSENNRIPTEEVPTGFDNRNIIDAPPRNSCDEPCYKRDARKVCRKILGCED